MSSSVACERAERTIASMLFFFLPLLIYCFHSGRGSLIGGYFLHPEGLECSSLLVIFHRKDLIETPHHMRCKYCHVSTAEHLLRGSAASRPPSALQRVSNMDSAKAMSGQGGDNRHVKLLPANSATELVEK